LPHAGVAEPHHATATITDVLGERDRRSLLTLQPMTSDVDLTLDAAEPTPTGHPAKRRRGASATARDAKAWSDGIDGSPAQSTRIAIAGGRSAMTLAFRPMRA
jgi:hypothetical protein